MPRSLALVAAALAIAPGAVAAQAADSAAVVSTINGFRAALAAGDSLAALRFLAPDATILESGAVETVAEYRSHHLAADIAFRRAVEHTRAPIRVTVVGDVAWATSTTVTEGTFRDRPVNSTSAELMVLSRTGSGWAIRAIHWSSRARR